MRLLISCILVGLWGCGEKPRTAAQQAVFELIEETESDPVSLFKFCREHAALDTKEKGRKLVGHLEDVLENVAESNDVPAEKISEQLNDLKNMPDGDLWSIGSRIEAICHNMWPKPRAGGRGDKSLKDLFTEEVDKFVLAPNPLVCKSVVGHEEVDVAETLEKEFLGMMGEEHARLRLEASRMQEIGEAVLVACSGLK